MRLVCAYEVCTVHCSPQLLQAHMFCTFPVQVPGAAGDFLQLQGKFMLASDDLPPDVRRPVLGL